MRHSIKSADAAMKADKALITAVMNQSPSCVSRVMKTLRDLGYIDASDGVIERHELGIAKVPANTMPSPSKASDVNPSDPLPANSHTLATCDVYLLAYLSERCEEITFSTHSMKALLRRNQRKLPKDSLLECLEFMTDIPRDISISTCGTVGNLADLCIRKNEANYRRARDLRLPPLWAEHGVGISKILFDGGNVYLQDRFTGATGMIRDPELLQNSSQGLKDWLIVHHPAGAPQCREEASARIAGFGRRGRRGRRRRRGSSARWRHGALGA